MTHTVKELTYLPYNVVAKATAHLVKVFLKAALNLRRLGILRQSNLNSVLLKKFTTRDKMVGIVVSGGHVKISVLSVMQSKNASLRRYVNNCFC